MLVTYSSNNSGGRWWLTDEDWVALENAGWAVEWYCQYQPLGGDDPSGEFLGALASYASKEFNSLREAVAEWEDVTGKDSSSLGCSCCRTPHNFSSDTGEYYTPSYPSYGEPYR